MRLRVLAWADLPLRTIEYAACGSKPRALRNLRRHDSCEMVAERRRWTRDSQARATKVAHKRQWRKKPVLVTHNVVVDNDCSRQLNIVLLEELLQLLDSSGLPRVAWGGHRLCSSGLPGTAPAHPTRTGLNLSVVGARERPSAASPFRGGDRFAAPVSASACPKVPSSSTSARKFLRIRSFTQRAL